MRRSLSPARDVVPSSCNDPIPNLEESYEQAQYSSIVHGTTALFGQHQFEIVTGKAFDSALPKDFYLEGNAIPTAKRNAVMVHLPSGSRALFSLIDTSGYSADIIAKYIGMIITEGDVSICGQKRWRGELRLWMVTAGHRRGWSR